MHKLAFQGLQRTFMHVSSLPPPCFDFLKKNYKAIGFLKSKYDGEDQRHA